MDIARLGITVDSSQVKRATQALKELAEAAEKAKAAMDAAGVEGEIHLSVEPKVTVIP